MHPFHSLFTAEPETEYVPDSMGRLGQGGYAVKPDPEPIGTPSPRFNEFIKAEQSGMGLTDLFGVDDPLGIKGPVGPFGPNRRADVGKVETFMSRSGDFDLKPTDGPTGYYGLRLEDSINSFQKANGLKPDGLLNPFGETIRTLAGKLTNQIKPPTRPAPIPKPAAPLTLPGQGAGAGQENVPLKHPGGGPGGKHPEAAAAAPPKKDPLEAFKKADRESIKGLEASEKSRQALGDPERATIKQEIERIQADVRWNLGVAKLGNRAFKGVRQVTGIQKPTLRIDRAIKAYERFLAGTGGVQDYPAKWFLEHEVVRASEQTVHKYYEEWLTGARTSSLPKANLIQRLLKLKENARIKDQEEWQARVTFRPEHKLDDQKLLIRNSHIFGDGKFTFTRKGNIIEVSGIVEHKILDPFTFSPDRVNRFPGGQTLVHNDMLFLQKHTKAKPFTVRSIWHRKMTMRLQIVRDPSTGAQRIVGVGKPRWSKLTK